ncbi:carbohydrate sulfotransferase 3-like [Oculina patagonica]
MSFANTLYLACILVVLGTILIYITMSDFSFTQPAPHPKERRYSSTERKMSAYVLILAQPRTGSSFLGQLFNQHPDIFYLYEPLYLFAMFKKLNYVTEKSHATLVDSFLRNISSCHLNGFQDYFSFISHPGLSSPHFRLSSKSLSSPPLCESAVQSFDNQAEFLKKCPPLDAKKVSSVCASKRFVAAKILTQRLPEVILRDLIEHFDSRAETPFKIIQLVRDPRAVVWSMIKMGLMEKGVQTHSTRTENNHDRKQEETSQRLTISNSSLSHNFIQQVKLVCDKMIKDVNISLDLSSKLSADQYRIIRYEELANSTLTFAGRIFKFAGIDFAPEVKDWLRRNSLFNKNEESVNELSYSTSNRNTTVTINSWRKNLLLLETTVIDEQCADFIRNFGYIFIDNVEVLTNISISLFRPLRKRFNTFL